MLESRQSRFLLNEAAAVITGGRPLRFLLTAGWRHFPPAKHSAFPGDETVSRIAFTAVNTPEGRRRHEDQAGNAERSRCG